jgi:RimJ/RimL family protein N-acetyltransferase
MIPRKLTFLDKEKLTAHLQSLQGNDRRLRFGGVVTDDYIKEYVEKTCDVRNNKWFGVDADNKIVAACHAAIMDDLAELGCSVDKEYRGKQIAQAMFDRAVTWLRSRGITDVCMHCLSENNVMKHIARKNDMAVVSELGETDANVHLEPPTPLVHVIDAYADRMALYDMMLKRNISIFRQMVDPAKA